MSGTTGKVALVSTGTPVPGPCSATAADTDIVDLVGYGTRRTATKAARNAPTPSNTTVRLPQERRQHRHERQRQRLHHRHSEPAPHDADPGVRTGVVNTDPANNASSAPRDASMIITFTEPVDVDPGWFNINCSTTGMHNDATFVEGASAHLGDHAERELRRRRAVLGHDLQGLRPRPRHRRQHPGHRHAERRLHLDVHRRHRHPAAVSVQRAPDDGQPVQRHDRASRTRTTT